MDPERNVDEVLNVGITGGRVAAISREPLEGSTVIDAEGLVVAPGFIDLHSHGQQLPAAWMQAFDGVTTALELESGLLPIGEFYDSVAAEGRPINYGASVAWTYARIAEKEGLEPKADLVWFQEAFSRDGWQNSLADDGEVGDRLLAHRYLPAAGPHACRGSTTAQSAVPRHEVISHPSSRTGQTTELGNQMFSTARMRNIQSPPSIGLLAEIAGGDAGGRADVVPAGCRWPGCRASWFDGGA
ncbi:amidohydrolase family protein [Streptomyces sp. NPDC002215]|uniref:amidohydrolase family protein n=1 Tax=Streptomyces sp. NPDC002215 TaxID=3154412 RepID=UPI00332F7514